MQPSLPPLAASLGPLDLDPRRALERLALRGYRHVQLGVTRPGLRPRDLDGIARRGLLTRLRQLELTLAGLDAWIPPADFVDSGRSDRAAGAVRAAVELAADLGRVPVSLLLPSPTEEQSELVDLIDDVLSHADRHGVLVVDHAAPPSEARDERRGLGLDPPAWIAQGIDPLDAVQRLGRDLAVARLTDLTISGLRAPIADAACGALAADAQLDPLRYGIALGLAPLRQPVIADARQWTDPWAGFDQTMAVWSRIGGASS